jgi:hypothetical protein
MGGNGPGRQEENMNQAFMLRGVAVVAVALAIGGAVAVSQSDPGGRPCYTIAEVRDLEASFDALNIRNVERPWWTLHLKTKCWYALPAEAFPPGPVRGEVVAD